MNSDLMPSPEPSNSAPKATQPNKVAPVNPQPAPVIASEQENTLLTESETANDENLASRQQPIPPPSEPLQYRAIGLIRGRYQASSEQFTQGTMLTTDGIELEAVLLGRIMSLVKNHLDLEKEHLWVVYPRTRQENDKLHLQIVGVWEPENLAKNSALEGEQDLDSQENQIFNNGLSDTPTPSSEIPDGGFSVRGEIVYQSLDTGNLVVKIKQAARKQTDKPKYFKLKLQGKLDIKAVGKFWDLQVKREADGLMIESGEAIADLPKKRKPPMRGGRRPFGGGGGGGGGSRKPFPPRRNGETPRPIRKTGDSSTAVGRPSLPTAKPAPKPVKRPKPPEN